MKIPLRYGAAAVAALVMAIGAFLLGRRAGPPAGPEPAPRIGHGSIEETAPPGAPTRADPREVALLQRSLKEARRELAYWRQRAQAAEPDAGGTVDAPPPAPADGRTIPEALQPDIVKAIYATDAADRRRQMQALGIVPTGQDYAEALSAMAGSKTPQWSELKTLIEDWTAVDPQGPREWVAAQTEGNVRTWALRALAQIWPKDEVDNVQDWLLKIPAGRGRDEAVQRLVYRFAYDQPEQAAQWYALVQSETFQRGMATTIARGYARKDTDTALTWINTLPAGTARDRTLISLVRQISAEDPEKGLALAEHVEGDEAYADALTTAVGRLAQTDPEGAAALVGEFPPGPLRDKGYNQYAVNVAAKAPDVAMVWAQEIGDEAIRLQSISHVGSYWMRSDADAFARWLREASVPDGTRHQLERSLRFYTNATSRSSTPAAKDAARRRGQ